MHTFYYKKCINLSPTELSEHELNSDKKYKESL